MESVAPQPSLDSSNESVLPRGMRNRLYKLFSQIENEFEREYRKLYVENLALQERLEKYEEAGEHGETNFLTKKFGGGASEISKKIRTTYKQSTSRLVSSLRPGQTAGAQLALGCRMSGHRDGLWDVSARQSLVASASADGTACVWSAGSGQCLLQYAGHAGSVNSVRFHDDLLLTSSGDCEAHLIRLPADLLSMPPQPANGNGTSSTAGDAVDVSGNAADTITVNSNGTDGSGVKELSCEETVPMNGNSDLSVPSMVVRTPLAALKGHQDTVVAADFLSADRVVTACWDRNMYVFSMERPGTFVERLCTSHDHELTDIRCAPGGQKMVLTASKDRTFRLWDFRDSALQVHMQEGHSQAVSTAQFVGSNVNAVVSAGTDRVCKVWDLRQNRIPVVTIRTDSAINRLGVNSAGTLIALPMDNRQVKFVDINGIRIGRLPRGNAQGHHRMVTSVCWCDESGCKNTFFSAGFDRLVLGWQWQTALAP